MLLFDFAHSARLRFLWPPMAMNEKAIAAVQPHSKANFQQAGDHPMGPSLSNLQHKTLKQYVKPKNKEWQQKCHVVGQRKMI